MLGPELPRIFINYHDKKAVIYRIKCKQKIVVSRGKGDKLAYICLGESGRLQRIKGKSEVYKVK